MNYFGKIFTGLALAAAVTMNLNCSSATSDDINPATSGEAMSSTKHSVYGMTTFGGPGDYQSMACGGNSRTVNQYFVASSQRYGCKAHLKVEAKGKCLVVYTGDAGPATFVEKNAGVPVLDSSETVSKYFFGVTSLGWSDLKAHPGKYEVHVTETNLPLGPCSSSGGGSSGGSSGSSGGSSSGGSSGSSGSSTSGSSGSSGSSTSGGSSGSSGSSTSGGSSGTSGSSTSGGGPACNTDGDCNPGNDGSGMICESGECVPGCHQDNQCPGSTTCVNGQCE